MIGVEVRRSEVKISIEIREHAGCKPGNLINTVSFLSFQLTFDVRLIKKLCFIVSGLNSVDVQKRC